MQVCCCESVLARFIPVRFGVCPAVEPESSRCSAVKRLLETGMALKWRRWNLQSLLCHAEWVMGTTRSSSPAMPMQPGGLLLAIDTCGPTGSVALGRLAGRDLEILGQTELEGRSYSSTLVAAVSGLLTGAGVGLRDLRGIVVVNGPGSFTGVRVGLSAVKGLAEGAQVPVVAVSRLEVLSRKAGVLCSALAA